MEEWRQIADTNYSVSNLGRIRNDEKDTILAPRVHTLGYYSVRLGRKQQFLIHRLVAEAFLPLPTQEGMVIDHINRIKTDNRVENLRWVTKSQNALNSQRTENASYIQFVVAINRQGKRFRGNFKTLQEAEEFRDKILKDYPVFWGSALGAFCFDRWNASK